MIQAHKLILYISFPSHRISHLSKSWLFVLENSIRNQGPDSSVFIVIEVFILLGPLTWQNNNNNKKKGVYTSPCIYTYL